MPKHKIHKYVDRLFFGKSHPKVHRAIDGPYKLFGKKHRIIFHTPMQGFIVGALTESSIEGGVSGALHVIVDQQTSTNKKLKNILELLTDLDSQKRTRNRNCVRAKPICSKTY
jgi:hypothetical protein